MNQFSRRSFLKSSGIALAGTSLALDRLANIASDRAVVKHLGVQLWSVRDDMNKDAKATIQALSKMGYREVEGFGYDAATGKIFGLPYKEYLTLLKDNGISQPSSHYMIKLSDFQDGALGDNAKKSIDVAAAAGQKYIVCPYMDAAERSKVPELVKVYQAAGEYCRKAGIRFGYHNHDFEFEKAADGRLIYEWLLQEVDPLVMGMEMDLYWVNFAKNNPLDWFERYPGRFELCHVKDMAKTEKRETVEVGDGSIDFNGIFKKRLQAGLRYYIIELENYVTTPMKGVERCRKNFGKLKF